MAMRTEADGGILAYVLLLPAPEEQDLSDPTPQAARVPTREPARGSFQRVNITGDPQSVVGHFTWPTTTIRPGVIAGQTRIEIDEGGGPVEYLIAESRERYYLGKFDGYSFELTK